MGLLETLSCWHRLKCSRYRLALLTLLTSLHSMPYRYKISTRYQVRSRVYVLLNVSAHNILIVVKCLHLA